MSDGSAYFAVGGAAPPGSEAISDTLFHLTRDVEYRGCHIDDGVTVDGQGFELGFNQLTNQGTLINFTRKDYSGRVTDALATDDELSAAIAAAIATEISDRDDAIAAALAANNLSGLLADLPAFGVAGRLYFATDEGVLYRDTGAAWVRVSLGGGEERAYASKSDSNFSAATGAVRDITGLSSITFDVAAGEVCYVRGHLPWNTHDTLAGILSASITDGADAIKSTATSAAAYAASRNIGPLRPEERITTPGSYTRKLRVQTFSGNATLNASSTIIISLGAYIYR